MHTLNSHVTRPATGVARAASHPSRLMAHDLARPARRRPRW